MALRIGRMLRFESTWSRTYRPRLSTKILLLSEPFQRMEKSDSMTVTGVVELDEVAELVVERQRGGPPAGGDHDIRGAVGLLTAGGQVPDRCRRRRAGHRPAVGMMVTGKRPVRSRAS